MRLIDADELIKSIDGNPFTTDSVKSYIHVSVAKMPTIEPERKKGRWLYRDGTVAEENAYSVYCSNCDEWSEYCTSFCGACGADMRR